MSRRPGGALRIIGAFVAYALLTGLMSWPVCARLTTQLIGNGDDMWVHFWNNWWVRRVLQQGGDLFFTPLLFHPSGVSLLYHNFAWLNIVSWMIIEPIAGGIAAYNLAYLVHIPLCGLAMFLLARRLTDSDGAAFVSGLTYAFWPYRMLDVNHPNMVSTEGFPLLMLGLIQLVRDDHPIRSGIMVGVLVALIGYTRWQLLILAGVLILLYLLYVVLWSRSEWTWNRVAGLALAGCVALSLMAPGLLPLVRDQLSGGSTEELYVVSATDPEQDLLAWVVPQHQHLLGRLSTRIFPGYGQSTARGRYSAFVGYVTLGLAILAVVVRRGRRRTWFWVSTALFCFVMALGPTLQINGVIYERVPLPYRLIGWLPPIRMLRHPHRFTALLALPVAALVGHGTQAVRQWIRERDSLGGLSRVGLFTGLLGSLILVDYWSVPTTTVSAGVPDFYDTLTEAHDDFAIAGLPGERQATERYMYYQTRHGHPILGGHVSRLPQEALAFASSVPLVEGIYRDGGLDTSASDISHQLSLLADAGFRYVVIHKDLERPEVVGEWQAYVATIPQYEDEVVAVYATRPVVGKDYVIEHELAADMGLVRTILSEGETSPDLALDLEVVWGATEPPPADLEAQVSLLASEGGAEQTEKFEISPEWPLGRWSRDTLVRDRYGVRIEPTIRDGLYAVVLGLTERGDGGLVGQEVEVGDVVVGRSARGRGVFPVDRQLQARFKDELLLLGYAVQAETDRVRVLLHWQALRGMEEDYKFFVHLCDPETLDMVAQADAMPHDWTHPTTQWEEKEVVSDELVLPVGDVPSGDYRLLVGVYSPVTGERLPIFEAPSGFAVRQDRLELPDSIRR